MSSLSWLDYSSADQRRALDAISLFAEKDTRDELGIGTVRDAFADLIFPGTSTIQTRARYFLFIPWIYLVHEARGTPSAKIAEAARRDEIALIEAIAQSEDKQGIIGIQARANLKRLPSEIYWQGLGRWGIRLFGGAQAQYHRSLDRLRAIEEHRVKPDLGEPTDGGIERAWHPSIPPAPRGFPKAASFRLTSREAEFLRERVLARAHESLLAFLVDEGRPTGDVSFPWEHPQFGSFPAPVKEILAHARNFSEAIHGAAILYNLMLAEQIKNPDLVGQYRDRLDVWASALGERAGDIAAWDRRRFWEIVATGNDRVPIPTHHFIEEWLRLALAPGAAGDIAGSAAARKLVAERERSIKGGLARLNDARALDLWGCSSGAGQLDYRWGITQTIINDILAGIGEKG